MKMTKSLRELIYQGLDETAEETVSQLAELKSNTFINLSDDWLQLQSAIFEPKNRELENSLFWFDFQRLFLEIHWMNRFLFWGKYAYIYRNLRYCWETISIAFEADCNLIKSKQLDQPGKKLNRKAEWHRRNDGKMNWKTLIKPVMRLVIQKGEHEHYWTLWNELNLVVHSSHSLRDQLTEESALLVRDGFDPVWAEKTILIANDVFDLLWLLTLQRFPDIAGSSKLDNCFRSTNRTKKFISILRKINQ